MSALDEFLKAEDERIEAKIAELQQVSSSALLEVQAKKDIAREQAMSAYVSRDLKPQEAALVLGVHVSTLKNMLKTGQLQGYRIGSRGDWRISREALQAFKARGGTW